MRHAELDEWEVLDAGDATELAEGHRQLNQTLPWLNVFGGRCGSELRDVTEIVRSVVVA